MKGAGPSPPVFPVGTRKAVGESRIGSVGVAVDRRGHQPRRQEHALGHGYVAVDDTGEPACASPSRRGRCTVGHLADYWGELCGSPEVAAAWADRLNGITRMALSRDKTVRGYFHGTTACLCALLTAGRHEEVVTLVWSETFWPYKRSATVLGPALDRG